MPIARVEFEVMRMQAGALLTHFRIRQDGAVLPDPPSAPLDLDAIAAVVAGFDNPGPAGEPVAEAGGILWLSLQAHENAAVAFAAILNQGALDRSLRMTFAQHALAAKRLPWEALLGPNGFLCNDRVAIAREIQITARRPELLLVRGEPLRVLAVIAPVGNDGLGEWEALKEAILRPRPDLRVQLQVMTSKPSIRDEIADMGDPNVTVLPISESIESVLGAIGDFRPEIAHFFGHGFAGAGSSFLEIETSAAENGADSRHHLSHSDLEQALSGSAWIVVLSACLLAAGGGAGTASMAEAMVARGIPVVIGMRDLVLPEVTHAFARTLHRSALDAIAERARSGSGPLDIGLCFADACRAIPLRRNGRPHPEANRSQRDWALPSLHIRSGPLDIEVIPPNFDPGPIANAGLRSPGVGLGPDWGGGAGIGGSIEADSSELKAEVSGEIEMLRSLLTDAEVDLPDAAKTAVTMRIKGLEGLLSTMASSHAQLIPNPAMDQGLGAVPMEDTDSQTLLDALTRGVSEPREVVEDDPEGANTRPHRTLSEGGEM